MSRLSPNVEQLLQIIAYFKKFPPEIMKRGADLVEVEAVKRLWWETEGSVLMAKVQGPPLYTQTIQFADLNNSQSYCAGTCSCPLQWSCEHVLLALTAYVKGWSGAGPDLDDEDHDFTAEKAEEAEEASEGALTGPAGSSHFTPLNLAKTISAMPSAASTFFTGPDQNILANALAIRFERKLTAVEKKRTALIDQLYQKCQNKGTADVLSIIAGQSKPYSYRYDPPVLLWPAHRPPATVTEAWLYVAHALKKQGYYPACALYAGVPWLEVQRLIAPWLREEAIAKWQTDLTEFNESPDLSAPLSPGFRLRLQPEGAQIEWRFSSVTPWVPIKTTDLRRHAKEAWTTYYQRETNPLDEAAVSFLRATCPMETYNSKAFLVKNTPSFIDALNHLQRSALTSASLLTPDGLALTHFPDPVRWTLEGPYFLVSDAEDPNALAGPEAALSGDYSLALQHADGTPILDLLGILPGHPNFILTPLGTWPLLGPPHLATWLGHGARIPVAAIESPVGLATLERLRIPLPPRVTRRVRTLPVRINVRCALEMNWSVEIFKVQATCTSEGLAPDETWQNGSWKTARASAVSSPSALFSQDATLTRLDRSLQPATQQWLHLAKLTPPQHVHSTDYWMERRLSKTISESFPDEFLSWLDQRPEGITVELDPGLAALRDKGKVTGQFKLDLEESGIDWFDLSLNLQLSDVELTPKEINLLLKQCGSWVRLPDRGWRRLDFEISDTTQQQLADLGLSPADLQSTEKQRLHVFQLAHPAASDFLPAERAEQVQRRAADLRTAVSPALPSSITATLRPYQLEGYHFLAYLSTNRFGGILADDMGLGKTLQALTWLAWLHQVSPADHRPILVVCPKSVQDNWTSEAAKFYPTLPVRQWTHATSGDLHDLRALPATLTPPLESSVAHKGEGLTLNPLPTPLPLLLIINYTQLRLHAAALTHIDWSTVILDEAQYIKNPTSITARTACNLTASHRLALSGTPIENRLLDLWSIMAFAMPGILGNRTSFAKAFNAKDDPLARRRLGSRVRPFLLRRTKKEVAADLPDRIEEDLICTLEGPQQEHYLAELKLARSTLLKAKTSAQLDKLRFNILTSLLRLRQICCHPSLTGKGASTIESAKLNTLLELLEPLIDEGHKVLIFSQFVEMLHLIQAALAERAWPHLLLTGATEDRGALVKQFQESEGANCFLISLKAGGSGLNLTAASYVVLFDPWWNPAVENQAIDRTHRIGQVNKVIAYRLITRDTIEEKIRALQKTKSALASDIFGEETFAKALTLDDFQFLLGH